jgi:hypothetical protein
MPSKVAVHRVRSRCIRTRQVHRKVARCTATVPELEQATVVPHAILTRMAVGSESCSRRVFSMKRRVFPLFGAVAMIASLVIPAEASIPSQKVRAQKISAQKISAQTVVKSAAKTATRRLTVKAAKPKVTTRKTTKKRAATTTTVPETTALPTTTTAAPVAQLLPVTAGSTVPITAVSIPSVTAPADSTTTTKPPATTTTTTTLPPAPLPAPANPPIRASAASIEPYRGVGAWVDRLDWTTQFSKKPIPPVTWQTMDQLAAAGVQTVYIQGAHWAGQIDVLEPDKLIPMINRAHELGMYVVLWYLPAFQDVNTDLRKVVALANLEIDGINIDIEDYYTVPEINERNRRLVQFSSALRTLLPGRFVTNDIVEPIVMDGVSNLWTQPNGQPPKAVNAFWRGAFPYRDIAPFYDLWMIQTYWTNRTADSGWRDGYRYVTENVRRLREAVGRPDLPVHVIGGVGDKVKILNDLSGFQQAAREVGSVGVSFYDWLVWPRAWWPYSWGFRRPNPDGTVDQRFVGVEPPVYVPTTQPPITTTTATLVPSVVPVATTLVPVTVVVTPA